MIHQQLTLREIIGEELNSIEDYSRDNRETMAKHYSIYYRTLESEYIRIWD